MASTALLEAAEATSLGFGRKGAPTLKGDDFPLEYYDDGFPKLPECLDRRKRKSVAASNERWKDEMRKGLDRIANGLFQRH
jgi:hypothetical protein